MKLKKKSKRKKKKEKKGERAIETTLGKPLLNIRLLSNDIPFSLRFPSTVRDVCLNL